MSPEKKLFLYCHSVWPSVDRSLYISIDFQKASPLYTSRVVSHTCTWSDILEKVYEKGEKYFPVKNTNGRAICEVVPCYFLLQKKFDIVLFIHAPRKNSGWLIQKCLGWDAFCILAFSDLDSLLQGLIKPIMFLLCFFPSCSHVQWRPCLLLKAVTIRDTPPQ